MGALMVTGPAAAAKAVYVKAMVLTEAVTVHDGVKATVTLNGAATVAAFAPMGRATADANAAIRASFFMVNFLG